MEFHKLLLHQHRELFLSSQRQRRPSLREALWILPQIYFYSLSTSFIGCWWPLSASESKITSPFGPKIISASSKIACPSASWLILVPLSQSLQKYLQIHLGLLS